MKNPNNLFIAVLFLFLTFTSANSQISQEWTHRYTGPEASSDTPNDFIYDSNGNMFVTGQSLVGGGFFKFITVKFNSQGVRQWVAKYTGPAFSNTTGNAITLDNLGNVYVTGYIRTTGSNYNMLTIKYNSEGILQWDNIYNGTGNFDDFGTGIVYDPAGYIYAGGYSFGSGTSYDFVVLKLDPSGNVVWNRRWNGASNKEDYLKRVLLSPDGGVVLAGTSNDVTSLNDIATVKYNSNGDFQWAQRYNGPANGIEQCNNAIMDNSGNIFVCGQSQGSGTGFDAVVVKYNPAGTQQWAGRFNGASNLEDVALALDDDAAGNIYVTGYSTGSSTYFDILTVKYNSAGAQQWFRLVNGPLSFFDKANDIKVDTKNNITVAGQIIKTDGTSDCETIQYDPDGNVLWNKTYDGPGGLDDIPFKLLLDATDNPTLLSSSYSYFIRPGNNAPVLDNSVVPNENTNSSRLNRIASQSNITDNELCGATDYLILKYSSASELTLETRYDGSGIGNDEASSISTDAGGFSYVSGTSFDNITGNDFATLKYSPSGAPLWVSRYDGGINGNDRSVAIAHDASGNVYVTGNSQGASSGYDIATVKYNSAGVQQWASRYNGPANGDDFAVKVAVDASGNVYVSGYSDGTGKGKDIVTIKYNASGVQQWAPVYNGPLGLDDLAASMLIDNSANVFVTGTINGTGSASNIILLKFNTAGAQQWAQTYNGGGNDADIANAMKLDNAGNIFIAGKSKTLSGNFDFITIKYNPAGTFLWAAPFNGSANANDEALSIDVDTDGNIITTGQSISSAGAGDITTIKYSTAGTVLWNRTIAGTANSDDAPMNLCTDLSGNIYVSGFTRDIGTGCNFLTAKYNRDGILKWEEKYNYIDNDTDKAVMVSVDPSGNVFVTGVSKSVESRFDFFTIKYRQPMTLELKALTEGYYYNDEDKMLRDTIIIYLRNSSSPYAIVDSSVSVIDSTGYASLVFNNAQNGVNYYLAASNRKVLETWSSTPKIFSSGTMYHDFTSASSSAYGNNLKLKGSKYCIFSGDVDKNNAINLADVVTIFNQMTMFVSGENVSDLNGDNTVNLTDLVFAFNNSINFVSIKRPA